MCGDQGKRACEEAGMGKGGAHPPHRPLKFSEGAPAGLRKFQGDSAFFFSFPLRG